MITIMTTTMSMTTATIMSMITPTRMAASSTITTRTCNRCRSRPRSRSIPTSSFPGCRSWCRQDGPSILRCKGILSFKDDDERFVFQGVHMILDGDHQRPWKEGEKRLSRLVFIGRNLPEEKIREGIRELRGVSAAVMPRA